MPPPSSGHGYAPGHCFGQWIPHSLADIPSQVTPASAQGYTTRGPLQCDQLPQVLPGLSLSGLSLREDGAGPFRRSSLCQRRERIRRIRPRHERALPSLPPTTLDRGEPQRRWHSALRQNETIDHARDKSYSLPHNLYIAISSEPLSAIASSLNDFCWTRPSSTHSPQAWTSCLIVTPIATSIPWDSAMMAYLTTGSQKHLRAARFGFDMVQAHQSFATGGWGPDEAFPPQQQQRTVRQPLNFTLQL